MGNGLLARLPRGRVPQVGRSDGWPPRLSASHRGGELDRIPPTGRLTVNQGSIWVPTPHSSRCQRRARLPPRRGPLTHAKDVTDVNVPGYCPARSGFQHNLPGRRMRRNRARRQGRLLCLGRPNAHQPFEMFLTGPHTESAVLKEENHRWSRRASRSEPPGDRARPTISATRSGPSIGWRRGRQHPLPS